MSPRLVKYIFFSWMSICIGALILSELSFEFVEHDPSIELIKQYVFWPVAAISVPFSAVVYFKISKPHEPRQYKSPFRTNFRSIHRVLLISLAVTFISAAGISSILELSNAYLGPQKDILLRGTVVNYNVVRWRRKYVEIKDPQLDRTISIRVRRAYAPGDSFIKSVKIGRWGWLYSSRVFNPFLD